MVAGGNIKSILQHRNLAPKKHFGQNFLIHPESARRIVDAADISANDTIIEIGVGFGALTGILAEQAKQVIGLEIDAGIVRWLVEQGNLPANVTLLHRDVMRIDFSELATMTGERLKIVANLPYSLSNPLLFKFVDNQALLHWAVIMLQKEVGDRLLAGVGSKAYGVLSVLLRSCATVSPLLQLGPGHFHPRPKVDSQVLRLSFYPPAGEVTSLAAFDRILFKQIVNTAFQQRRKTLVNALTSGPFKQVEKHNIAHLITEAGIDPGIRAEQLSVADYVELARSFRKFMAG
jgi:16S rRNA (adenine1518-N6/adenine1519-N6)-dimethyltransferase